jgi:hypothetical protein
MQLAKSTLYRTKHSTAKIICTVLFLLLIQQIFAQENSPYSRYGLGDLVPNTNIVNRGMGGISAAYTDILSINYNNPASYSNFQTQSLAGTNKVASGRVLLDVGINYDSRTLQSPNQPVKFSSSYGYFSHVQVGLPLTKKWGLSFGLRPISRMNYKINRVETLTDPVTGKSIDTAATIFSGNGGSFLPTIGTGFAFGNFSLGGNIGYLFGKKEVSTKRIFLNDSVAYQNSNYINRASFGGVFFNAGAQYKILLDSAKEKQTSLRLGVSGNWKQNLNATRDEVRQTFFGDANGVDQRLDSVYEKTEESGEIVYPSSYTMGFVIDHSESSGAGWLLGVDYVTSKWDDYRFFNEKDAVQNSTQIRVGGQLRPKPATNYFSNVSYRAGFFIGKDYINVEKELPQFGLTFGLGLPLANYSPVSRTQFTIINLGFEYSKRGKSDNLLKENLFRVSVGLNLSDLWFSKRRYD